MRAIANTAVVFAAWDSAAKLWRATSKDTPALVAEAETYEELIEQVLALAPALILAAPNADRDDEAARFIASEDFPSAVTAAFDKGAAEAAEALERHR